MKTRVLSTLLLLFSILAILTYLKNEEVTAEPVIVEEEPLTLTWEVCAPQIIAHEEPTFDERVADIDYIEDNLEWFKEYKKIISEFPEIDIYTIYDALSDEDIHYIQRMVETECYHQDFMSKVNVANVALNRYESGLFGETITELITDKKQFAYGRKNITEDTVLAVEYAYMFCDTTYGSIGFHSNPKTNTFNGWEYTFSDDAVHHFYSLKED